MIGIEVFLNSLYFTVVQKNIRKVVEHIHNYGNLGVVLDFHYIDKVQVDDYDVFIVFLYNGDNEEKVIFGYSGDMKEVVLGDNYVDLI